MKNKKQVISCAVVVAILLVIFFVYNNPTIEGHTWVLTTAQQADAPYLVVAHKQGVDLSTDGNDIFSFSKEIDLICTAKGGKLTITDKTNGKTYEGTYKATSLLDFAFKSYDVVIDGKAGVSNISSSSNRNLVVSIDGYLLSFEAQ